MYFGLIGSIMWFRPGYVRLMGSLVICIRGFLGGQEIEDYTSDVNVTLTLRLRIKKNNSQSSHGHYCRITCNNLCLRVIDLFVHVVNRRVVLHTQHFMR